MNTPTCVPVIFGPHITPHCPASPWWSLSHVTAANLGWVILTLLLAGSILGGIQGWVTGQYEFTRRGFRLRVSRRWYGVRAWVIMRDRREDNDEPERLQVLQVDDEDPSAPWIKVASIDLTEGEDAVPFWLPVTYFAPEAVRRLRPWIFRYRRLPLPVLFAYKYVGDGACVGDGADERTPAEINTAYYLNTAAWKRPYDPPGTLAALMKGHMRGGRDAA